MKPGGVPKSHPGRRLWRRSRFPRSRGRRERSSNAGPGTLKGLARDPLAATRKHPCQPRAQTTVRVATGTDNSEGDEGPTWPEQAGWLKAPASAVLVEQQARNRFAALLQLTRDRERSFLEFERLLIPALFALGRLLLAAFLARRHERLETLPSELVGGVRYERRTPQGDSICTSSPAGGASDSIDPEQVQAFRELGLSVRTTRRYGALSIQQADGDKWPQRLLSSRRTTDVMT